MKKHSDFDLVNIGAEETYAVRHPVLRPNADFQSCQFDGDHKSSTFHLGIKRQERLVAVASFLAQTHSEFFQKHQYQLRGMAVLPEFQNRQLGQRLLLKGEELLRLRLADLLWFNARESAVEFYKRFGYNTYGDPFMIPGVCMHVVMKKELH